MTLGSLRLRNLLFHWRGNLAVLLGVVVGTAVLTGALLVGDSLRGSLHDLTQKRLGWIDHALIGPRFLRQEMANQLEAKRIAPALVLRGSLGWPEQVRAVRQVNVLGVNEQFWAGPPPVNADFWKQESGVVINLPLAQELARQTGESDVEQIIGKEVRLRVNKTTDIPSESLLGRRDDRLLVGEVQLAIKAILDEKDFGHRFSLQPTAEIPRNAFIPLSVLQQAVEQPNKVNSFFVEGGDLGQLHAQLKANLTLEDWDLRLVGPEQKTADLFARFDRNEDDQLKGTEWLRGRTRPRFASALAERIPKSEPDVLTRRAVETFFREKYPYFSLESRRLLLEDVFTEAALDAAGEANLRAAPTLVYLANTLTDGETEIPYVLILGVDPTLPQMEPLLPGGIKGLKDDEIQLVDWKQLEGMQGKKLKLVYFPPEQHGTYDEESATFMARPNLMPLTGPALDPYLTPEFPGVTDKEDIQSWDPPDPPFKNSVLLARIKPNDANEQFWEQYRTTPRGYVTLDAARKIWGSRYGNTTSIRLAPQEGNLDSAMAAFEKALLAKLDPEKLGLSFQPMREQALTASAGGGFDFSLLFLGFSFFLIVAALLLVGLLFRLNLDRRASEIGLLVASGYRRSTVRWLLLSEGGMLAILGALVGTGVAIVYARGLLYLLQMLWPGGSLGSFLEPHVGLTSLAIGFASSVLVSVLTIFWAIRVLGRVAPSGLLAGRTEESDIAMSADGSGDPRRTRVNWSRRIAILAVVVAAALLAGATWLKDQEMKAGTFFGSGAMLLTACLAILWGWMRSSRHTAVTGSGWWSIVRLGVRNSARFPTRSILTAGLLASAAFLLVAVEAFRRTPGDVKDKQSSLGGFSLLGESDLPILVDLNSQTGHNLMIENLQRVWQDEVQGDALADRLRRAEDLLEQVRIYAFRVQGGDDASCLNLYQPNRPRVLGVPAELIDRGGFHFASTTAETEENEENPWRLLTKDTAPYPTVGEKNSVAWMLKKGLGDEIAVPDGQGVDAPLRIAGLLQDSIFQSGLLVSENNFLKLYPNVEGYRFFLIETPSEHEGEVKDLLELGLANRGFAVGSTRERLEAYLAVEGTYLSTFQALGALGLVLGSLGLAIVLLRGVWERRGELALLRALGYRRGTLAWLVLAENGFLLLVGLVAGTVSALIAVAPHLLGHAAGFAWDHLLILLAIVLVVAFSAAMLAILSTLRAPLIPALRKE